MNTKAAHTTSEKHLPDIVYYPSVIIGWCVAFVVLFELLIFSHLYF